MSDDYLTSDEAMWSIEGYLSDVVNTINNMEDKDILGYASLLMETYEKGGTIYVFGNGGSGATASHFCGDLVKGASYGLEKRFKAVCLNDNTPSMMAISNDISYDDIFVEQLKNFLTEDDLVIGISGSGNSANVLKAIEYANSRGIKTVGMCGFKGGKLKDISSLSIHAAVHDMEVTEDVHHSINHCVKKLLMDKLGNYQYGEEYEKRVS